MPKPSPAQKTRALLLAHAMAKPGAHEDFPWGELVVKVAKKVFVFLGRDEGDGVGFSVKLTTSLREALAHPRATPTGYGLGKSGWVSFDFPTAAELPMKQARAWLDESYINVAPAKLSGVKKASPAKKKATTKGKTKKKVAR